MLINYYDTSLFNTKATIYNNSKKDRAADKKEVVHLDVTDIRKKRIECPRCGTLMDIKEHNTSIYYDIENGDGDDWKFLYITYHYVSKYRCKKCRKTTSNKIEVIPGNRQVSPELKKKIAYLLWAGNAAPKITQQKLIKQYTIDDFKGGQEEEKTEKPDGGNTIRLITKSRITDLLKDYQNEVQKLVKSYKIYDNLIYYPFVYMKKDRGAVFSCKSPNVEPKSDVSLYLYHFSEEYSDASLANFLSQQGCTSVSQVRKIFASPIQFPFSTSNKIAIRATVILAWELLETELYRISDRIKHQIPDLKKCSEDLTDRINDIIEGDCGTEESLDSFQRKIDACFLAIKEEDERLFKFYDKLYDSYSHHKQEWYEAEKIYRAKSRRKNPAEKAIKNSIGCFEDTLVSLSAGKAEFEYLLTKIMLEIPQKGSVIRKYSWNMGSLKKPVKQAVAFSYCKASLIMLRPVCDEYFIMPVTTNESSCFLVVGYDEKRYCRFDVVKGKTPRALVSYFKKLTIWEQEQVKSIYCRFDRNLIYSLKSILFDATFFVDLEEIVDKLYAICTSDDINELMEILRNINKPDYELIDDPYPMEIPFYRSCADILQEWYDNLDDDRKRDFSDVYARLSAAPELLKNSYLFAEKRPNYPEVEKLADIICSSTSHKELLKKARNHKIKRCIDERKELAGHRVLMGYADLEIALDDWLNCINSIDWTPISD